MSCTRTDKKTKLTVRRNRPDVVQHRLQIVTRQPRAAPSFPAPSPACPGLEAIGRGFIQTPFGLQNKAHGDGFEAVTMFRDPDS